MVSLNTDGHIAWESSVVPSNNGMYTEDEGLMMNRLTIKYRQHRDNLALERALRTATPSMRQELLAVATRQRDMH